MPERVVSDAQIQESDFQARVLPWLLECFGSSVAANPRERNYRFIEESLELVQAAGCSKQEVTELVDYVFSREVGEKRQEVGGVMVTLAALCLANGLDMYSCGEVELERIWSRIDSIRLKHENKPTKSPLPQEWPPNTGSHNG